MEDDAASADLVERIEDHLATVELGIYAAEITAGFSRVREIIVAPDPESARAFCQEEDPLYRWDLAKITLLGTAVAGSDPGRL